MKSGNPSGTRCDALFAFLRPMETPKKALKDQLELKTRRSAKARRARITLITIQPKLRAPHHHGGGKDLKRSTSYELGIRKRGADFR